MKNLLLFISILLLQAGYSQNPVSSKIKVYFNHPVDTSFKTIQAAVNLADHLDDTLINYINRCDSTLDIAIYSSSSPSSTTGIAGAINNAWLRGVVVRVIYDPSTTSSMIPYLNGAIPKISSPSSGNYGIMHNKFVVFDAKLSDTTKAIVWTGSTNWSVSQIDGPDRNNVIILQDKALANAYTTEFEEMWGSHTNTPNLSNSKFGPDKTDNTQHLFTIDGIQVECYFSPSDGANSKIINAINSGNSDINICTMLITRTDIKSSILNKFNAGVKNINVVVDKETLSSNQFSTIKAGISANHAFEYNFSGIMHHKFMVVDNFDSNSDPLVETGSHNWSTSAETLNDENMLIVHDANIANQYYQAFAYIYKAAGGTLLDVTEPEVSASSFVIYPNPSGGKFYYQNQDAQLSDNTLVRVYDLMGKEVLLSHKLNYIDLTGYPDGIYLVQFTANGSSVYQKIVKN